MIPPLHLPLAAIPYRALISFDVGPVTVRTFGVLVAIGVLAGAWLATRYVSARGVDGDTYTAIAVRAVIAGFVGARLGWVVSHGSAIHNPIDVIAVWDGGLQFSGGFVLAVIVGVWYARGRLQPGQHWTILDGSALGLTVGLAIGRLGCMAVGEHLGGPTDFFLGWKYLGGQTVEGPLQVGVTYHSTALYELLHLLVLASIMGWLIRRAQAAGRRLPPGFLAGLFLTWYAVARFLTDTLRTYDERVLGLTGAQWGLLAVLPLGIWVLATANRRGVTPEPAEDREPAAV